VLQNSRRARGYARQPEGSNIRPGYYGKYAVSRDLTDDEIRANLDAGKPFVIRYRANGDYDKKMKVVDLVKGERLLAENDTDDVILKSTSPCPPTILPM
jgi:glutamyl-tRNA synthetase